MHNFNVFCLQGVVPNMPQMERYLQQSLMLVTAFSPALGYEKCSEIAKKAHKENKTLREVILEMGLLSEEEIDQLGDVTKMV